MILLRKKRITFIVFSVFLSILVFTLIKDKKEIVPTVSLPVSGKTIVIDARTSENQMKEHKVVLEQQKLKQI